MKILDFKRPPSRFMAEYAREQNLIGKKIQAARKAQKLTQIEFIERLKDYEIDLSLSAYSKWEMGTSAPNGYQLLALCSALNIGYDFFTAPDPQREDDDVLNYEGRRMLKEYRVFLESNDRYISHPKTRIMPVSNLKVSAGTGEPLDDESFEQISLPASQIPDGADFGVYIHGDSMEPLYRDGQLVWIHRCDILNSGDVGLFILEGHGYVKMYNEYYPDEKDPAFKDHIDSYGILHPGVALVSYNEKYSPIIIAPEETLKIAGRVLS